MEENPYKSPTAIVRPKRRRADKLLLDAVAIGAGALVIGLLVAAALRVVFPDPAHFFK